MPCAPWVSWSLDEHQLPIISLFSLLWSNCLLSPMTSSSNLPNNVELFCEHDQEYSLREQAPFRNMEIIWIVSFRSGKWIVLAVVTSIFASVLMGICATSPDMSIQNPRKNWHEPKHFMNEYNSATVVESTVLLIYWLSQSTRLPYDSPSFEECSRNSTGILSCLSVKTHQYKNGHKKQAQTKCSHQKWHHGPWGKNVWVCECWRCFRSSLIFEHTCEFLVLTNMLSSQRQKHGMVLLVESVREKSWKHSGRKPSSPMCAWMLYTMLTRMPCAPGVVLKFGWTSTSKNLLLWSNCLPSPMTWSNNLPSNSDLQFEQGHAYFLNRLLFATWKSCDLFHFAQVSELFLLLSPGSSRQSSCEFL